MSKDAEENVVARMIRIPWNTNKETDKKLKEFLELLKKKRKKDKKR